MHTDLEPLMGHGFGMMGHGFGLLGLIPAILLTALLIVVLVRLFRRGGVGPVRYNRGGHGAAPSPEEAARSRLAERLANGDITPEEYLERTSALRSPTTSTDS